MKIPGSCSVSDNFKKKKETKSRRAHRRTHAHTRQSKPNQAHAYDTFDKPITVGKNDLCVQERKKNTKEGRKSDTYR